MQKYTRQLFLISLLTLALAGMQAIKESPWHDHGHHVADCALCHIEHFESAVTGASAPDDFAMLRSVYHATVRQFNALHTFVLYQSRAPPHHFS